jgi:hypothetical protein
VQVWALIWGNDLSVVFQMYFFEYALERPVVVNARPLYC